MPFQIALERLAEIIKRSKDQKLKVAFKTFLDDFNRDMETYRMFLQVMAAFGNVASKEERWDMTLVQPRRNKTG